MLKFITNVQKDSDTYQNKQHQSNCILDLNENTIDIHE